jgi:hypothetical protein
MNQMTSPCCDYQCDFRPESVRRILAAIDVARVTHMDPVEIARSVLNPRGERTIGRVGIDIENPEEDAALEVIAVQDALKRAPKGATAEQIALICCPYAIPIESQNEQPSPEEPVRETQPQTA